MIRTAQPCCSGNPGIGICPVPALGGALSLCRTVAQRGPGRSLWKLSHGRPGRRYRVLRGSSSPTATPNNQTQEGIHLTTAAPSRYSRYLRDATLIHHATFVGVLVPVHHSDAMNLTEALIIPTAR